MSIKGQTEFRQPKMRKERIPDKGITVSQSSEKGKPRLVTEDLKDWGLFSENFRKK